MQNKITEINNSLKATNSRIQEAEEQIRKVEDRLLESLMQDRKEKNIEKKQRQPKRTLGQC